MSEITLAEKIGCLERECEMLRLLKDDSCSRASATRDLHIFEAVLADLRAPRDMLRVTFAEERRAAAERMRERAAQVGDQVVGPDLRARGYNVGAAIRALPLE